MTRYAAGDAVRIRADYPPGHMRTPVYLRGKQGVVQRFFGEFDNAETAAYGLKGPKKGVYKVRFDATHVWPEDRKSTRLNSSHT